MCENEYPTCSTESLCIPLGMYVEGEQFEISKGFCTVRVINLVTGNTRLFGVAYKRRKSDKGVMLNFCPFCGQKPGIFDE